jgi:hypothetical protein
MSPYVKENIEKGHKSRDETNLFDAGSHSNLNRSTAHGSENEKAKIVIKRRLLNHPSVLDQYEPPVTATPLNLRTDMRSPVTIRKLCSSVNNSKLQSIFQIKKNNRNLNYNIIRENRKQLNQTIPNIKQVDENQSINSAMSTKPYIANKAVKLPTLQINTPKSSISAARDARSRK